MFKSKNNLQLYGDYTGKINSIIGINIPKNEQKQNDGHKSFIQIVKNIRIILKRYMI